MCDMTCFVLFSPIKVITNANNTLNGISSSSVCTEVIQSAQGMEYLLGEEKHRPSNDPRCPLRSGHLSRKNKSDLLSDKCTFSRFLQEAAR